MPLTDYNKTKKLEVTSQNDSGTTQDKAQPVLISGESVYDITSGSFSESKDISSQADISTGMAWNSGGTKMYIIDASNTAIYEYDVSTAYDISTATFSQSKDISSEDGDPRSIVWNDDGTKMYTTGRFNSSIYEYDVSTAYDISTATFSQSKDISSEDGDPQGIAWNDDGTKVYIAGSNNSSIYEYNVSTAYDISTATFSQSISTQDGNPTGVVWNNDGSKLYEAGDGSDEIYEYNVSTAYDISTATFYQKKIIGETFRVTGLTWNDKGTIFFVVDGQDENVYEYSGGEGESKTGNGDIVIDFSNISDAQDIAVYDQNGNLLDYEIEDLDTTNETATLWAYNSWTRDDSVQAQIAYGDNSANTDRQNVTGTWNNTRQKAQAVYHWSEQSGATIDSTAKNTDSTKTIGTQYNVEEELGGARRGDGVDDYVEFTDDSGNLPSNIPSGSEARTLMAYFNWEADNNNKFAHIFNWGEGSITDSTYGFFINQNSNELSIFRWANDQTIGSISKGTNYHAVATYDGSSVSTGYLDGVQGTQDTSASLSTSGTEPMRAFSSVDGDGDFSKKFLDAILSEIRIYSEEKSDDWIQADYDASPKAGQVFFSQQAAETTGETDSSGTVLQTVSNVIETENSVLKTDP